MRDRFKAFDKTRDLKDEPFTCRATRRKPDDDHAKRMRAEAETRLHL